MKNSLKLLALYLVVAVVSLVAEEEKIASYYPVDITFLVIDLKYNQEEGVKICEIQPGLLSKLTGYMYVNNREREMAEQFCDVLSTYHNNIWYSPQQFSEPLLTDCLNARGGHLFYTKYELSKKSLFLTYAKKAVYNPYDITNYQSLVCCRKKMFPSYLDFFSSYPSAMILDAAFAPFYNNKLKNSRIFLDNERLEKIKPKWGKYEKKYTSELATKITNDLKADTFVIKPIASTLGNGVIIVHRSNLDKTLKKILRNRKKLNNHPDKSYRYWSYDDNPYFLVEKFIPSDPVSVDHLEGKSYNATMRVVYILAYHQQKVHMHYLGGYWKLPEKSIDVVGTLNERYKSIGKQPYFCSIDQDVEEAVRCQVEEALPYLYKKMLETPPDR